jgi:hypothetical protein
VPKLLWICTRVKWEVINNKTTWVRVKSTGSKTYLSKKYKVSLKILEVQSRSKSTIVYSVYGGGDFSNGWHTKDTKRHWYMRQFLCINLELTLLRRWYFPPNNIPSGLNPMPFLTVALLLKVIHQFCIAHFYCANLITNCR